MENHKKKRSLKENIAMISRGYKIVAKVYSKYIIWTLIYSIFKSISPYFSLYMSALVINEIAYSRDMKKLLLLAGITVGGLFAFRIIERLIEGRVNVYGSDSWRQDSLYYLDVQNKMRYEYLENPDVTLLREKIKAAGNATGGGLRMLYWNVSTVISAISNIVFSIALTISLFTLTAEGSFSGILRFVNSQWACLIIIGLIFINIIISTYTTNRETQKVSQEWTELAVTNCKQSALRLWSSDVYIYNMHKIILRELKKITVQQPYILRAQKHKLKYGTIRLIWNYIMTAGVFIFVAAKVYIGTFGIGSFILYQGTVSKFINGVSDLAYVVGRLIQNNDELANLFEFIDMPDDRHHGTRPIEKGDASDYEIEFRDVSFKYPQSEIWALRHISVKFKFGERLAVVGMNGSGKTTFIKLLCRLYAPTEGQILLNGINISEYKHEDYMRLFAVVFQDYKIFSFNIAENVAANFQYDEDRVLLCLKNAGLEKKMAELEKGVETFLHRDYEHDGIDISGGEAQKLAMARAFYKDSPFVVLDEPTAALDPIAEAEIYERFDRIVGNKTAIYISHRLSSCHFCDRILVFNEGNIVQSGKHHELLSNQNGKYFELWSSQAQYYI